MICNPRYASDRVAIDVGAHHGEFARFLVSTGYFGKVFSFEPNPECFVQLLKEVSQTSSCRFEPINSALSYASGTHELYCDKETATASLLKYGPGFLNHGTIKRMTVPVITLDEYLNCHPVAGRIQFLKIDTQGNDLAVIMGSTRAISAHRPIIQTEFIHIPMYVGQCSPANLSEALSVLDYEMYSMNNLHVTPEGRLAFCDVVFVPRELEIPMTQEYSCIDNLDSFQSQISTLDGICAERLLAINLLDAEVRRLRKIQEESSSSGSAASMVN